MAKQEETVDVPRGILTALQEIRDFLQGKKTNVRVTYYYGGQRVDTRAIRKKLGMTRAQFARTYGLETEILRKMEENTPYKPPGHLRAYLLLIDADPEGVKKTLNGGARTRKKAA